jgi:hypothetical protein
MVCLPPIPSRPNDRPETWSEYCARRAIIGLYRQFNDDLVAWLNTNPPPRFDPFSWVTYKLPPVLKYDRVKYDRMRSIQLPPVKRQLRQVWSCGRVPGHEHASYEEALRCQSGEAVTVDIQVNDALGAEYVLKRFVPPKPSDELVRRIEGTI